ncbi:MAG: hypothetical protein WDO69_08860 [Pseudomonadota bacterium]
MSELSRDARALIEQTRARYEPTDADRSAVRAQLAVKLARGAASLALLEAAREASRAATPVKVASAQVSMIVKWLIGGALFGTLGIVVLEPRAAEHSTLTAVSSPPFSRATERRAPGKAPKPGRPDVTRAVTDPPSPPPVTSPLAREAAATVVGHTLASSTAGVVTAPRAAFAFEPREGSGTAPATRGVDLMAEARALTDAQRALNGGQPALALELLAAQDRRFSGGALGNERIAARVFALCALGRKEAAHADAAQFLAIADGSPLAARVRAACR